MSLNTPFKYTSDHVTKSNPGAQENEAKLENVQGTSVPWENMSMKKHAFLPEILLP